MIDGVSIGNASNTDHRRGWFIGHFIEEDPLRCSTRVQVKWGTHDKGNKNVLFKNNRTTWSLAILVKGCYRFIFRRGGKQQFVCLDKPGDYVLWCPQIPYKGYADRDATVVVTVRWPSVPDDQVSWSATSGKAGGLKL
jgi:hypothetical protein